MNNSTDPKNEEKVVPQEEWEINRNHHKSLADAAFRSADYKTAIQEYSSAITFDPDFHILYSNRSAAYLANGEKSRALADAKKCVSIQPDFVKGHNRLASSMLSLGRWNEARGVYRHILTSLDEMNEVARKGLEDCRIREQNAKQAQMEMTRLAQERERAEADAIAKAKANVIAKADAAEAENKNINTPDESTDNDNPHKEEDEEDDLLGEFFDEVEEVTTTKKASPEKSEEKDATQHENKIQIQMKELGDFNSQIQRLLRPNHEWYNLNPFLVLDISHQAPVELISRRYKALSLLLHPDKVRNSSNRDKVEEAERAFEYVRKAMNSLKDEDKAKHFRDLIDEGMKQGKRDYEGNPHQQGTTLESFKDKATMKIFAEIERRRRDVEKRKRNQEKRERDQEDAEIDKIKKERNFEKSWKDGKRTEKRIGNWRNFSSKANKKRK
jgi:DnaJ family protein C protein 8